MAVNNCALTVPLVAAANSRISHVILICTEHSAICPVTKSVTWHVANAVYVFPAVAPVRLNVVTADATESASMFALLVDQLNPNEPDPAVTVTVDAPVT